MSLKLAGFTNYPYIFISREVTTVAHTPRRTPFPTAPNFGMWDQVADVINHANFTPDEGLMP